MSNTSQCLSASRLRTIHPTAVRGHEPQDAWVTAPGVTAYVGTRREPSSGREPHRRALAPKLKRSLAARQHLSPAAPQGADRTAAAPRTQLAHFSASERDSQEMAAEVCRSRCCSPALPVLANL